MPTNYCNDHGVGTLVLAAENSASGDGRVARAAAPGEEGFPHESGGHGAGAEGERTRD